MSKNRTPFPRDPEEFKSLAAPADGKIAWIDLKDWLEAWPDQPAVRALWSTLDGLEHEEAAKRENIDVWRLTRLRAALRTEFAEG
jgi:hypothetical protein